MVALGSIRIFALLVLLALVSFAAAAPPNYTSVCAPWTSCKTCTTTSVCHIGQECVQCGWCPSDGKCYVRPLDCTSWVPWNRTDLCPSNTPVNETQELELLWKIEKYVLIVLGALWLFFICVCICTCIGLRGRPRDFDGIMVDDFMADTTASGLKLA